MDLLSAFANQAAISLDLLQRARRAHAALADDGDAALLARVAAKLEQRGEDDDDTGSRDAALQLLRALEQLL